VCRESGAKPPDQQSSRTSNDWRIFPSAVLTPVKEAAERSVARLPRRSERCCQISAHRSKTFNVTRLKARNRSTKSRFMRWLALKRPLLLGQTPGEQNSLRVGKTAPELDIVPIRIRSGGEAAHRHPCATDVLVVAGHHTLIPHREGDGCRRGAPAVFPLPRRAPSTAGREQTVRQRSRQIPRSRRTTVLTGAAQHLIGGTVKVRHQARLEITRRICLYRMRQRRRSPPAATPAR
jgi:hypothetical protein